MAQKKELTKKEIIEKIVSKKEFSDLPRKDVEMVFDHFDREEFLDEEKIKLSRDLLRKMYTAFVSGKLLNIKDKSPEWFLKKHISTKERVGTYEEVYSRCLEGLFPAHVKKGNISIYDLGSGINGFSYDEFLGSGFEVDYFGFEAVGQLVDLQNSWFKKESKSATCVKGSLFDLEEVKEFLSESFYLKEGYSQKKGKRVKVVFLFKTLDSLEMLKRNYSKDLLKEVFKLVDRVVISFATKSLVSKKKFFAERLWLRKFLDENFKIVDEFEAGIEKYIVVEK